MIENLSKKMWIEPRLLGIANLNEADAPIWGGLLILLALGSIY